MQSLFSRTGCRTEDSASYYTSSPHRLGTRTARARPSASRTGVRSPAAGHFPLNHRRRLLLLLIIIITAVRSDREHITGTYVIIICVYDDGEREEK